MAKWLRDIKEAQDPETGENKFISLSKGYESCNWQLSNLTKLYSAGLDGVVV